MRFIDWFAGIGGFRRGMELAGHECVGFCEFDKYAVMSYTAMHLCTQEQLDHLATLPLKQRQKEILKEEYRNGEWYADDVRTVDARSIPDADCWCFGFPCQDISVAGKQLGFTGNRSSLFFRIMYMVGQLEEEKRPSYLFIENVKNLLSVNGGWDFAKLLSELDKNGYDAEWSVLNSKYFGVPQNRERCFIIGHLRGRSTAEVFPVEGTNGADNLYKLKQVGRVKTENRDNPQRNRVYDIEGLAPCLSSMQCGHLEPHVIKTLEYKNETSRKEYKVAIPCLTPDREKRQNGRRFKTDGEPAFTVTSRDRHRVAVEVKPEVIGGVGEKNFGKQWRQGNRVYDAEKVATALESHPVGNSGGNTNLYAVRVDVNPIELSGHNVSGGTQSMTVATMHIEKNNP